MPSAVTVNITASCKPDSGAVTLDKWIVPIKPGGKITWTAVNPGISIIKIRKKAGGRPWPFPGPPELSPGGGGPGNGPRGDVLKTKGRYGYDIELTCLRPGGPPLVTTIDPDIIIVETWTEFADLMSKEQW